MRVPQVSDRIKEAPAVALRGVLAGMGQLLLIADRLRNKTGAGEDAPQVPTSESTQTTPASAAASASSAVLPSAAPAPAAPAAAPAPAEAAAAPAASAAAPAASAAAPSAAAPAEPATTAAPKRRDLNKTGNVRLLTGEDEAADVAAGTGVAADAEAAAAAKAPAAKAPAATTTGTTAGLPLANYDDLSVASLRARLRNLTAAQVSELVVYEKAHAARQEIITMFERRIAKLEAGA